MKAEVLRQVFRYFGIFFLILTIQTEVVTGQEEFSRRFLKGSGNVIRDKAGKGKIVVLRGTNLGGWMLQEGWMCPLGSKDEKTMREVLDRRFGEKVRDSLISIYQDSWIQEYDLDVIQSLGMNMVRVPMYYLNHMNTDGSWKLDPWKRLDWLVKECTKRKIYVLLDLHGAPGGQNDKHHSGREKSCHLWIDSVYQNMTIQFWEELASHYRGNATICGYDLLNECEIATKEQQNDLYNRIYKAVRAVDPDHSIHIEAFWDWEMLYPPSHFGWQNVVYHFHHYAMSGMKPKMAEEQDKLVNGILKNLDDHSKWNVPFIIGEFCLYNHTEVWKKFLASLNKRNISWATWTYKVKIGEGHMANWGLFNLPSCVAPDLNSDSARQIGQKWKAFSTKNSFTSNTSFQNLLKEYTSGKNIY